MKLHPSCWLPLAFGALLLSAPIHAQDLPEFEIGLKPFGTYHGGAVDNVSVTNGNLTIDSPLFSYPQRGGRLNKSLHLIYNNKGWRFATFCSHFTGECFTRALWQGSGIRIMDPETVLGSPITCGVNTGGKVVLQTATSDLGATHVLGDTGLGYRMSIDGSGIRKDSTTGVIFHRDGTRYGVSSTVAREDSNGNQINADGTDTLGRLISNLGVASDTIGCPVGPRAVTASIITVPGPGGTTSQIKYCNASVNLSTSFGVDTEFNGSTTMIQSVVLYNGSSWSTSPAWSFEYGPLSGINYGDLTKVTFPTGGTISYTWTMVWNSTQQSRAVASRTVDANDGTGPHTWTYTPAIPNTVTDPLGNDTVYTVTYVGFGQSPYVTKVQSYQGSRTTGTLLKTETTDYTYTNILNLDCSGTGKAIFKVFPIRVTTTWPGGKVSKVETDYDTNSFTFKNPNTINTETYPGSFGQVLAVRRYDYGSGAPGPLVSQTINAYMSVSSPVYKTYNFLDLLSSVTIKDGAGVQKAYTWFGYDEYSSYPLQSSGVTTQHNTSPPNGNTRGNQTSVHRWVNTNGSYLVTSSTFFDTGTVKVTKDAKNNQTIFDYSPTFVGAYPTAITNSLLPQTVNNYDFNTGLLAFTTDPNGQTTSNSYDSLFRLTQTSFPDGGQTTFSYQDSSLPFSVTVTKKITPSLNLLAKAIVDGVGRTAQTQLLSDPDGTVYVDITYDAKGRKGTVSNPYRTPNDPGPTNGITSFNYDALGRVTKVIPPDGTSSTNNVATVYADNCTTVTDQAGKKRKSCTDGLGRLTQVFEPNSAGSFVHETDYQYDALNNLTRVDQKGNDPNSANWRTRTFVYDSLSRLTSASNPESGMITYAYTAADGSLCSGNPSDVCRRTDARGITTTYVYADALNRLTGKTFSNGDAAISFVYDQTNCLGLPECYNVGRRTSMTDAAGSESWAYDQMGRSLKDQRTTSGITKSPLYTYNLDGSVATLTYPSGRMITYTPSGAGRALSAVDTANSINYATNAHYAPQGALSSVQNGTGFYSTFLFDKRLQPCWLYTNTASTGVPSGCAQTGVATAALLDFQYDFSLGVSDNGNVNRISNRRNTSRSITYAYDELNRIKSAITDATSGQFCWAQLFGEMVSGNYVSGYDIWANLKKTTPDPSRPGCNANTLGLTISNANKIIDPGFGYDLAGNLTADPGTSATYQYDAENRLKSASSTVGSAAYLYDGDGKRVAKAPISQPTQPNKIYWYGMGSEALDESDGAGTFTDEYIFFGGKRIARRNISSGNIFYYFADHLGTSRAIVQEGQSNPCYDADFYPFGGEAAVATNTCPQNYKFTGKERDTESVVDYFGARYYSGQEGRWLTPDWSALPDPVPYSDPANPQSFNLYSYVKNNPLNLIDSDGHSGTEAQLSGKYTAVLHKNNPNDLPNIHVKKSGNTVARATFRADGTVEWKGEVGAGIRAEVEALGKSRGFFEAAVQRQAAIDALRLGRGAKTTSGLSKAVAWMQVALIILDAVREWQSTKTETQTGYHYNSMTGLLEITNLSKAAENLPVGSSIQYGGLPGFPQTGTVFTLQENGLWMNEFGDILVQDENGDIRISRPKA